MPDKTDISNLVRHIRTVHFALLVACFLTLVPVLWEQAGEVGIARDQLGKIIAMHDSWDTWTKRFTLEQTEWFKGLGFLWFGSQNEQPYISSDDLDRAGIRHSEGQGFHLELEGFPVLLYVYHPVMSRRLIASPKGALPHRDTFPTAITFPANTSGGENFRTLEEFRIFWDAANELRVYFVHKISSKVFLVADGQIDEIPISYGSSVAGNLQLKNRQSGCTIDANIVQELLDGTFNDFFCNEIELEQAAFAQPARGMLILPAETREPRVPASLRDWLNSEFSLTTGIGDFSEAFYELNGVTSFYQELGIREIDQIIQAELDRSGDPIEILGLRIPQNLIATLGAVIIIVVQIYLLLHVRTLMKRMPSSDTESAICVGWIGIYEDGWARFVTLVTVGFIPPVVLLIVAWTSESLIVGSISTISGYLAFVSSRQLPFELSMAWQRILGLLAWTKSVFQASTDDPGPDST